MNVFICYSIKVSSSVLTFRHRASSIQDRHFANIQRTLFIYLINKYISLSDFMFMVSCITIFYEITNRCKYMQSILLHCQFHSTCFGCHIHPSSRVQFSTVSTATGTNHSIVTAPCSRCGLVLHIVASVGYFIASLSDICLTVHH